MSSDETALEGYVLKILERAASSQAFEFGKCFACGREADDGVGEHIIPRWVQKRFNLSNKLLTLINGTRIPYRQVTVPCCLPCNNGFLRKIENGVVHFLETDMPPDAEVRFTIGRWLAKIYLGLLLKETSLPQDRSDPSRGMILQSDFLEEFRHAQFILQSGRKRTTFRSLHGLHPFTLYLYQIEEDPDFELFDLTTNLFGQSIAIRIGLIGMIFVNDGGLQHEAGTRGPLDLEWQKLHPIQFSEVAARVHYKATLRDATHSYVSCETPKELFVEQVSVRSFSGSRLPNGNLRIFQNWDDIECAQVIDRYRQADWGPVYNSNTGLFSTTLRDENGDLPPPKSFFR